MWVPFVFVCAVILSPIFHHYSYLSDDRRSVIFHVQANVALCTAIRLVFMCGKISDFDFLCTTIKSGRRHWFFLYHIDSLCARAQERENLLCSMKLHLRPQKSHNRLHHSMQFDALTFHINLFHPHFAPFNALRIVYAEFFFASLSWLPMWLDVVCVCVWVDFFSIHDKIMNLPNARLHILSSLFSRSPFYCIVWCI